MFYNIFIITFFVVQPICDYFASLANSVGPVLPTLRALILIMSLMIIYMGGYLHKKNIALAISLSMFFMLLCVHFFTSLELGSISVEFLSLTKMFYFPISLLCLDILVKKNIVSVKALGVFLVSCAFLMSASIAIGFFSGFGGVIGGRGTLFSGTKGFMIGANEVGLMLLITMPYVFALKLRRSMSWVYVLVFFVYLIIAVLVFTKSSLACVFLAFYCLFEKLPPIWKKMNYALFLSVIILFVCFNLNQIAEQLKYTFFKTLVTGDFASFFLHGRESYVTAIWDAFINQGSFSLNILFGIGEFMTRHYTEKPLNLDAGGGTLFEMDFFDFFVCYGLIGFVALIPLARIILRSFLPQFKTCGSALALALVLIHSFLAGHVLFSPQVLVLISVVLIYEKYYLDQQNTGRSL